MISGGVALPRATWKGFLRLSLVSCPVYLTPATSRAKPVRLHQVWVPRSRTLEPPDVEEEDDEPVRATAHRAERNGSDTVDEEPEEMVPATRITMRPHDPQTGAEIEREEVAKGYEYERGQFVTLTADELKSLAPESSDIIDLATFAPRSEVDPIYFNTSYYIHPDGAVATEAYRVIGAALTEAGMVGLGRLMLARRERMVMVEPRGNAMMLITLRSADEIRPVQFR